MYVSANRAEISIRALCGSSSVLCRHLVSTPFGSKWLLCSDLVLENKRAYFRFGGHLLEIHSNSYENQGATSGANKRKRAQISATGRKIKKCSFDHHFSGFLEHILNLSFIWKPDLKNGYWDVCVCMHGMEGSTCFNLEHLTP